MNLLRSLFRRDRLSSSHKTKAISPAVGDRGSSLRREEDAERNLLLSPPEKRFPRLMPQSSMEQVPEGISKRATLPAIVIGGVAFAVLLVTLLSQG